MMQKIQFFASTFPKDILGFLNREVVELLRQDTKKIKVAIYGYSNTMDWVCIDKTSTFLGR